MTAVRSLALLALLATAGCAAPLETADEARARRTAECGALGFAPDSPDLRLCLLLQQTNERLAGLDRRLSRIEQDVMFPGPYPSRRGWW